jgi:hypothetical protein
MSSNSDWMSLYVALVSLSKIAVGPFFKGNHSFFPSFCLYQTVLLAFVDAKLSLVEMSTFTNSAGL